MDSFALQEKTAKAMRAIVLLFGLAVAFTDASAANDWYVDANFGNDVYSFAGEADWSYDLSVVVTDGAKTIKSVMLPKTGMVLLLR